MVTIHSYADPTWPGPLCSGREGRRRRRRKPTGDDADQARLAPPWLPAPAALVGRRRRRPRPAAARPARLAGSPPTAAGRPARRRPGVRPVGADRRRRGRRARQARRRSRTASSPCRPTRPRGPPSCGCCSASCWPRSPPGVGHGVVKRLKVLGSVGAELALRPAACTRPGPTRHLRVTGCGTLRRCGIRKRSALASRVVRYRASVSRSRGVLGRFCGARTSICETGDRV